MTELRFLHISTFYPPYSFGGDAVYLQRLAHLLGDCGHQVDVVYCRDSFHLFHPGQPSSAAEDHPNVHRHELRSPLGPLSPLVSHQTGFPLLQQRKIRELTEAHEYDVIHVHNGSLFGPGLWDLPARGNPVRFYTAHEHWLVCPTHVLLKYDGNVCAEPECLKCTLKHKRPPQLWRYTGLFERKAKFIDQFFSPSQFTVEEHAKRGFSRKMECLPYFMAEQDEDWQNPAPRPQERPYYLFVGRLEHLKGVQELIAVWDQVPDVDLLIAGDGDYAPELKRLANGNRRIRFLGRVSQPELGPLYHHALACVVPSITYETFGIVCIEAFARKTPVIVHDLGGLSEVAEQSHGGLTYRNRQELIDALRVLADVPAWRRELGENGYAAFRRNWTPEAHLEHYYSWINKFRPELKLRTRPLSCDAIS